MTVEEEEISVSEQEYQIDISKVDFSDLERKYAVSEEDPLENVIIVDGTPSVDVGKKDKLLLVLKKKFKDAGCGAIKDVYFPEADGKLKG
jgi:spore coat protein CotH